MRLLSLTEFDNNFKIIYDFINLLAFLQFLPKYLWLYNLPSTAIKYFSL